MSLADAGKPNLQPWLDTLVAGAWGIFLLSSWLTGKLNLLVHPDYRWLAVLTGSVLLLLAVANFTLLLRGSSRRQRGSVQAQFASVGV
jgi:uncharacterized membrane protein YcgQ (UPF0703/DUF1980 family)